MKNWRTTISGIMGNLMWLLTMIAMTPPSLQDQIPQLFPEKHRGQCAIILGLLGFLVKGYQAKAMADATTKSSENANPLVVPSTQPQPETP